MDQLSELFSKLSPEEQERAKALLLGRLSDSTNTNSNEEKSKETEEKKRRKEEKRRHKEEKKERKAKREEEKRERMSAGEANKVSPLKDQAAEGTDGTSSGGETLLDLLNSRSSEKLKQDEPSETQVTKKEETNKAPPKPKGGGGGGGSKKSAPAAAKRKEVSEPVNSLFKFGFNNVSEGGASGDNNHNASHNINKLLLFPPFIQDKRIVPERLQFWNRKDDNNSGAVSGESEHEASNTKDNNNNNSSKTNNGGEFITDVDANDELSSLMHPPIDNRGNPVTSTTVKPKQGGNKFTELIEMSVAEHKKREAQSCLLKDAAPAVAAEEIDYESFASTKFYSSFPKPFPEFTSEILFISFNSINYDPCQCRPPYFGSYQCSTLFYNFNNSNGSGSGEAMSEFSFARFPLGAKTPRLIAAGARDGGNENEEEGNGIADDSNLFELDYEYDSGDDWDEELLLLRNKNGNDDEDLANRSSEEESDDDDSDDSSDSEGFIVGDESEEGDDEDNNNYDGEGTGSSANRYSSVDKLYQQRALQARQKRNNRLRGKEKLIPSFSGPFLMEPAARATSGRGSGSIVNSAVPVGEGSKNDGSTWEWEEHPLADFDCFQMFSYTANGGDNPSNGNNILGKLMMRVLEKQMDRFNHIVTLTKDDVGDVKGDEKKKKKKSHTADGEGEQNGEDGQGKKAHKKSKSKTRLRVPLAPEEESFLFHLVDESIKNNTTNLTVTVLHTRMQAQFNNKDAETEPKADEQAPNEANGNENENENEEDHAPATNPATPAKEGEQAAAAAEATDTPVSTRSHHDSHIPARFFVQVTRSTVTRAVLRVYECTLLGYQRCEWKVRPAPLSEGELDKAEEMLKEKQKAFGAEAGAVLKERKRKRESGTGSAEEKKGQHTKKAKTEKAPGSASLLSFVKTDKNHAEVSGTAVVITDSTDTILLTGNNNVSSNGATARGANEEAVLPSHQQQHHGDDDNNTQGRDTAGGDLYNNNNDNGENTTQVIAQNDTISTCSLPSSGNTNNINNNNNGGGGSQNINMSPVINIDEDEENSK